MQVSKTTVPLRMNFDPTTPSGTPSTPDRQLKRLMISRASEQVFQETRRQLTSVVRKEASNKIRGAFFQDIGKRLASTREFVSTPSEVKSKNSLRIGPGEGSSLSGIDGDQAISRQSFSTPVRDGSIGLSFEVNGAATPITTTIAIDDEDDLNSVLTDLNNLTIGGQHPLVASFSNGQFNLQVTSGLTTNFDFDIADGTSNFVSALTNGGLTTGLTATAGSAVTAGVGTTNYNDLQITFNGNTLTATGLTVSSTGLTATQRAVELATQINNSLAGSNLVASAVNGLLRFSATDEAAAANPDLGLAIQEIATGGAKSLGLSGGFTATATLAGTPTLTGPDATLGELATRLGLQSVGGRFAVQLNDTRLNFLDSQTLSDVVNQIDASQAGLDASYDATDRRVTLAQREAGFGGILARDIEGNLLASLELAGGGDQEFATARAAALGADLQRLGDETSGILSLLGAATANNGPFRNDSLLRDLGDALRGLFEPTSGGRLSSGGAAVVASLGDLGFSQVNGQLQLDQTRLQTLVAERPEEIVAFVGTFISEQVSPLLAAGQRALEDDLARAPLDLRLAEQAVHIRGEIVRLQTRQQIVLQQTINFENQQERLKQQAESLDKTQSRLAKPDESEGPDDESDDRDRTAIARPEPAAILSRTEAPNAVQSSAAVPGLLSFGLSN